MPFPSVTLLDSFKRALEQPLSNGGKWSAIHGSLSTGQVGEGEAWQGLHTFPEGEDGAYWNVREFNNPALSVDITRAGLAVPRKLIFWLCLTSPGTAAKSGYRYTVTETVALAGESESEVTITIERVDNNVPTVLKTLTGVVLKNTDSLGFSLAGGVLTLWHKPLTAGAWAAIAEAEDATYVQGYVGLGAKGNLGRLQNFSAASGHTHTHTLTVAQPQAVVRTNSALGTFTVAQPQLVSKAAALQRSLAISQGQTVSQTGMIIAIGTLVVAQPQIVRRVSAPSRTLSTTQPQTIVIGQATSHVETPPPPAPPEPGVVGTIGVAGVSLGVVDRGRRIVGSV